MIYVSLTCDVLAIHLLSVLEVFNDVFLVNLRRSFHERHLNPFISQRLRISTFTWPWCFAFPSIFMSFLLGGGLVCWVQNLTGLFFAFMPYHYCHGDLFTMCAWKVTPFHSKVNNFILMMKCVWGWLWWGVVVAVVTMVFLFILLLTCMESMSIRRISMQSLWTGGCRDDIFFKNSVSLSLSNTHSSMCVCVCVYYIYVSIYRSIHPSIPSTAPC